MKKVNWGILSTASIGKKQLIPAIERSFNAEAAAIASRGDKARQAAAELGIKKAYTSYEQLLEDPDIDAVYIPLPNSLHKQWVVEAAKHGKHVLCEKPASLNEAELQEMLAACHEHGVKFMEAFMYQFHPQHEKVRDLIRQGEIGEVSMLRASFSFLLQDDPENIRLSNELGGGSIYDVGCYCLHSIREILQEEPIQVYAHAKHNAAHVDTTVAGTLSFASGVEAVFDCSFDQLPVNRYEVVGSTGKIEVQNAYRPDKNPDGAGLLRITNSDGETVEMRIEGDQYKLQVEHFSEAVLQDKPLLYTEEKMLNNIRTIDACYKSITTGEAVRL
ncbi:Gfo/Idh/MocA family protein [Sediminibacillus halophilus]|uniref:Predicted dehydrogenase n=1 Tax=Sediminibacillus halophilus TaxID=482461 RepID=A0A1G9RFE4_9BACI|nr:Gfo/Idh/MocA family oxidoreductase [Sediminibacillus halophilus]SDM22022.1 Predicted dehydrogenase [Sediminibacillus halophilus]